jgi:hypothetical protein
MNLISRRRLSRLEIAVAERNRRAPERAACLRQVAFAHAIKLATLILHGNPKIEEPLALAWDRALDHLGLTNAPQAVLSDRLRAVVAGLPGDTEIAKIAHVLSSAPSWLLKFCRAAIDCCVLGMEFPKSSEPAPKWSRDGLRNCSWPGLPTGTIGAGPPVPKSNPWFALSFEEGMDLIRLRKIGEENWLRRDRHRFSEIRDKMNRAGAKPAISE